jgi:hypothetical protein
VIAFYSISHTPREQHAPLFAAIASWVRPRGVFVGNLHSRDDPDDFEADWLGAGPMWWSGFDGATNLELLTEAGFTVIETAVVHQIDPEGCHINPMWFVAQRKAARAPELPVGTRITAPARTSAVLRRRTSEARVDRTSPPGQNESTEPL